MTIQINIRISEDFFKRAKEYAKNNGFLNIQEFFRETMRQKIYDENEVKIDYLEKLNCQEATTFLSDKENEEFEKDLNNRAYSK